MSPRREGWAHFFNPIGDSLNELHTIWLCGGENVCIFRLTIGFDL